MCRQISIAFILVIFFIGIFGCGRGYKSSFPIVSFVYDNWQTGPQYTDNLNPPRVSGQTLWIGRSEPQNRKNGYPDSWGTQVINCGFEGRSCEIEYTWGAEAGFMDQEKLIVRLIGGNYRKELEQGDSHTQHITVEVCGTFTFEVTVDTGTNAADIASLFEIGIVRAECN